MDEWISVEDRLPECLGECLVYLKRDNTYGNAGKSDIFFQKIVLYSDGKNWHYSTVPGWGVNYGETFEVTDWIPIPDHT